MTPEGLGEAKSGSRWLTRQEILALDREALADLLVELCRSDAGLDDLLSQLPSGRAGQGEVTQPFVEPFMVGESEAMKRVFETIRRLSLTDAPVLIQGESGSGKELAARAIHDRSAFAGGPFVAFNCGGLPSGLIASELFGHEEGVFTGAHQRKIGRVEAAEGGTLMLDEIGDLPLDLQPHLLRFLQEMTIERIGGNRQIHLNLRVIATTKRNLEVDVAKGRFREDLFLRLNRLSLDIPPLRQRGGDIELLARFFVARFSAELGQQEKYLGEAALSALREHSWPGNVRELISRIRRAVVMTDGHLLSVNDLGLENVAGLAPAKPEADTAEDSTGGGQALACLTGLTLEAARAEVEERLVRAQLAKHEQNVTYAARALGVSRVMLYRLIDKHHIRHRGVTEPG